MALTQPPSVLLSQKPGSVSQLTATVVSESAVRLNWTPPIANAAPVTRYHVEWFTMFLDPPFFGVPEVQRLTTTCTGTLGGYFTVSYNDYEVQLPGGWVPVRRGRGACAIVASAS